MSLITIVRIFRKISGTERKQHVLSHQILMHLTQMRLLLNYDRHPAPSMPVSLTFISHASQITHRSMLLNPETLQL
jgi:hypothetical protein